MTGDVNSTRLSKVWPGSLSSLRIPWERWLQDVTPVWRFSSRRSHPQTISLIMREGPDRLGNVCAKMLLGRGAGGVPLRGRAWSGAGDAQGHEENLLKLTPEQAEAWLDLIEETGRTPEGMGMAGHFLYIGQK